MSNSGKEVLLYLTKTQIINIGKQFLEAGDSAIWLNFIASIKQGIGGGGSLNTAQKAALAYATWKSRRPGYRIAGTEILFPLYLTYLVFFVLPLTESATTGEYIANNYWGRVKEFFKTVDLPIISTPDFRDNEINCLWADLERWANNSKNGELGLFSVNNFVNSNFEYVGKPFSQCIIPPKVIKKLPLLFYKAGLIPAERISDASLKRAIVNYGIQIGIHREVTEMFRKKKENALSDFVVKLIKREYEDWQGQSDVHMDKDVSQRSKRYDTISRLLLQIKPDEVNWCIEFSYRLKSNDIPEDLTLGSYRVFQDRSGFSKRINAPYHNGNFEIRDEFNKWIAKFPSKEVRIFINASFYKLDSDYWIEVDSLMTNQDMFILCKSSLAAAIEEWSFIACTSRAQRFDSLEGLPSSFTLFKITNPQVGSEIMPELSIDSNTTLELIGGLKVGYRSYADVLLPVVYVNSAIVVKEVYLQYGGEQEKTVLTRQGISNFWQLPEAIRYESDFYLGFSQQGIEQLLSYRIRSTSGCALNITDYLLPKRGADGNLFAADGESYLTGVNLNPPNFFKQKGEEPKFKGRTLQTMYVQSTSRPQYKPTPGDKLLSYLTLSKKCTTQDFFSAFEQLYIDSYTDQDIPLPRVKRASLNHYTSLGFVDYDFETKEIIVLPPQLILLPTKEDRKALLIGARDEELIERLISLAPEYSLSVEINKQNGNENLLLPSIVTLQTHQIDNDSYGEKRLEAFANKLGIKLNINDLVQVGISEFTIDISKYMETILGHGEIEQVDYTWARRVLNIDTLRMDKVENELPEKEFLFVEYRLTDWEIYHRLWIKGKCYKVDRNWGKFLILKEAKRNILLYDIPNCKVSVPVETPLPRYMSMTLCLMSGVAPAMKMIDGLLYRVYENIPATYIKNLAIKVGQEIIESKIL